MQPLVRAPDDRRFSQPLEFVGQRQAAAFALRWMPPRHSGDTAPLWVAEPGESYALQDLELWFVPTER